MNFAALLVAFSLAVAGTSETATAADLGERSITYHEGQDVTCQFKAVPLILRLWGGKQPDFSYFLQLPGPINQRSHLKILGQYADGRIAFYEFDAKFYGSEFANTRVRSARLLVDGRDLGLAPQIDQPSSGRSNPSYNSIVRMKLYLESAPTVAAALAKATTLEVVALGETGTPIGSRTFQVADFRNVPAALKAANYNCGR